MRGTLGWLSDGDTGIYETVALMRDLARAGSLQPLVRETTAWLLRGAPGNRQQLHARLIRDWIGQRVMFLADPRYAETLHAPDLLLRQILRRGIVAVDCDDVATLTAAMGLSVGLRARFVVVGFSSPNAPYRHVWAELAPSRDGAWVPVDPTRPAQGLAHLRVSRSYQVEI